MAKMVSIAAAADHYDVSRRLSAAGLLAARSLPIASSPADPNRS